MKQTKNSFLEGSILSVLLRFSISVLLALILQALYGAVDLWAVGKFGTTADVSAVATGSQAMQFRKGRLVARRIPLCAMPWRSISGEEEHDDR